MAIARSARWTSPSRNASAVAASATARSFMTGHAARAIVRTGSRGKSTCPTSRATPPPMSASTKRLGDGPWPGCTVATTRIAEIAAWLTRIVPAPRSSAADMASATTTTSATVLVPSARTMRSATAMPTATPAVSSIARTVRRPRATPRAMTADTGAKNGLLWIVEASS
jgi:hypothetical protein